MTAPPLFLHLMADRNGSPAALVWGGAEVAQEDLPSAESLRQLAAGMRCFYREGVSPAIEAALRPAGWQPLPLNAVLRADSAFDKNLPPAVQWVDGDWFLAPPPKPVGAQAVSRALALQLVQLVTADADTHEIEALLRQDPTLSYHLLKLVNSLGMGAGRKVTSFSQAILILGRSQLRRWLNLMLFSSRESDMRSAMLLARVAVRAHALEQLCKALGQDKLHQEQGFMAGMFSLLGVLFGMPLENVLQPLTIGDEIKQALLTHGGELGALLALLEAGERGQHARLPAQLAAVGLDVACFNQIMADANLWMQGVAGGKAGSAHA
ncbi:MAG: HDOD domain-containing protein [Paucibacter sp.]|nr:HDOD domain-containing protein [Roseateles sp.]